MFKKALLSTLLAFSTIITAQVNLDLNLTIVSDGAERQGTGSLVVDENVVTSITFNGLESLIINLVAQVNEDETVVIQTQFFQKIEDEELTPLTDPLGVQVEFNEPATIKINEPETGDSLVLVITPSQVE
jgi:hypothetical protein